MPIPGTKRQRYLEAMSRRPRSLTSEAWRPRRAVSCRCAAGTRYPAESMRLLRRSDGGGGGQVKLRIYPSDLPDPPAHRLPAPPAPPPTAPPDLFPRALVDARFNPRGRRLDDVRESQPCVSVGDRRPARSPSQPEGAWRPTDRSRSASRARPSQADRDRARRRREKAARGQQRRGSIVRGSRRVPDGVRASAIM